MTLLCQEACCQVKHQMQTVAIASRLHEFGVTCVRGVSGLPTCLELPVAFHAHPMCITLRVSLALLTGLTSVRTVSLSPGGLHVA